MRKNKSNTCTALAVQIDELERDGKDVPKDLMQRWEKEVRLMTSRKREAMRREAAY